LSPDANSSDSTVPTGSADPRCSGGDLSPAEAAELLADEGIQITAIDTRTPAEYADGHVPGAVNLSTQDAAFWDQVGQLPTDGIYVLYCRSGSVTQRVMQQMLAMGFGSVCHIESGFNGWVRAGLPVEEGAA
jgi:rhodanese-related sulfurtransferase